MGPVDSPNAADIQADPATWGQSFLTGANGHGYMLDHVRLNLDVTGDPISAGQNITKLVAADSSGQATGTEVATLSSLGDLAVSSGTEVTAYAPARRQNSTRRPGTPSPPGKQYRVHHGVVN